jgi:uncharacterized protein
MIWLLRSSPVSTRALLLVWLSLFTASSWSEDLNSAWLAEHYTKYEHLVPMRDGVRLFTRVYVPKNDAQSWPILLTRTPYSLKPYGDANYNDAGGSFGVFAKDQFILVTQDVRGRYGSEGQYEHVRPFNPNKGPRDIDESSDAFDTIDWLVKMSPTTTAKWGCTAFLIPAFIRPWG